MMYIGNRFIFLATFITVSAYIGPSSKLQRLTISDWASITTTPIYKKISPTTITELQEIVRQASRSGHTISVWGAGYSQGGQTAYKDGIVIDMQHLKTITHFNEHDRKITVQAGATWKEILDFIDPYNLSVRAMQSYYNFSVGGSLSVNVHGRDNTHGQIVSTVESIKIVPADGSLVNASRQENYDLFRTAIGGYGFMGIIAEVTLDLTKNCKLEREVKLLPVNEYKKFFIEHIQNNPDVIIHNGNLYPNDFSKVLSIAWKKTDKALTNFERIQPAKAFYPVDLIMLQIARRVSKVLELRSALEPKQLARSEVAMRNYVMAYDTKSMQPLIAFPTSHILQEYFIPCDHFDSFVNSLGTIINKHGVNVLNCSIRFVKKNTESLLSYARHDSFSFVLYINILNTSSGKESVNVWTQELIDSALSYGGSFYLPYILSARHDQLLSAYPDFGQFLIIKKRYDPSGLFSNELFRKYVEC